MSGARDGHEPRTLEHAGPRAFDRSLERPKPVLHWTDAGRACSVELVQAIVAGSASAADIVLGDRTVSRLHAEFDFRPDGVWVRDLGSTNGTYVGAVRVAAARVPEGGEVRLGSSTLTLVYATEPARVPLWPDAHFGRLLGSSHAMREMFARLARIATLDSTVLVYGETGTGKELVAQTIHEASPRRDAPFVVVDCAGLPESLLESELFGHAKGAFTGAAHARAGAIESAEGGTVFLDEIGELPLSMQPKLLRVLESRTVRRLGESTHRDVNVRFVSATHRDLRTMVNQGAFREDLYFRLAVLPVTVAPLRERPDDLALLTTHFLAQQHAAPFDPRVVADLARRPWLGNVRELRNFVERAVALGASAALDLLRVDAPLPPSLPAPPPLATAAATSPPLTGALSHAREQWIEHFEREYIRLLLESHARDVPAAARTAGVDKTYIYRLIRKHRL